MMDVTSDAIIAEQAEEHRRELRKLDDIAFALLEAAGNDTVAAARMLDDFVALLFEDGVLSTWRYKFLLDRVKAGL